MHKYLNNTSQIAQVEKKYHAKHYNSTNKQDTDEKRHKRNNYTHDATDYFEKVPIFITISSKSSRGTDALFLILTR